jgi:membrane protein YdbS with pleckstrin-like domain
MLQTTPPHTVNNITIAFSVVLLSGVLSMAYGFFHHDMYWTHLGVFVTAVASIALIIQTIVPMQFRKR